MGQEDLQASEVMCAVGGGQIASPLHLPFQLRLELELHALAEFPREACGTLIGRRTSRGVEVVQLEQGRNLAASNVSFRLDPAHLVQAEALAQAAGLEVVGIWHSHPNMPAIPSAADLENAWAGWSHLIASVTTDGVSELCEYEARASSALTSTPELGRRK